MYPAIEVSLEQDLGEFSRLLWQRRIAHRLHKLKDRQVLAVPARERLDEVQGLYQRWQAGELAPAMEDSSDFSSYFNWRDSVSGILGAFWRAPVTLLLVAVCILLAFATDLGRDRALVSLFLYPDFSTGSVIYVERVLANLSFRQLLNMISPILLHFSLLHIAFNMLWLWELGKRIEARQASWSMVLLVVVLALISNTGQYLFGGGNNFGGMSGVVYGLFAYIWMWQLFDPAKGLALPGALIFFMLLSLGIMTYLNLDMIADAAHVGGLLAGVVYGALLATFSRMRRGMSR